jgi:hypothetical protein
MWWYQLKIFAFFLFLFFQTPWVFCFTVILLNIITVIRRRVDEEDRLIENFEASRDFEILFHIKNHGYTTLQTWR